jgi:hypothetical protein
MASIYQLDFASDVVVVNPGAAAFPISLSGTPSAGDIIMQAICIVSDTTGCKVQIQDSANGTPFTIADKFPTTGTFPIMLGVKSSDRNVPGSAILNLTDAAGWFATTGGGVQVVFIGRFR